MCYYVLSQLLPIIPSTCRLIIPKVELEFSLRQGGTLKWVIGSINLSNFHRSFHRSMIDGFMNEIIYHNSLRIFKANLHHLKGISESLHTDTNRSMFHVRVASLFDRIVVSVDYLVKVFGDTLCHPMQSNIVELSSLRINEFWQSNRG